MFRKIQRASDVLLSDDSRGVLWAVWTVRGRDACGVTCGVNSQQMMPTLVGTVLYVCAFPPRYRHVKLGLSGSSGYFEVLVH